MIIFGNGFIGHRIHQHFGCVQSTTHGLTVERAMAEIEASHANVVVNAVASTGRSNCDECEYDKSGTLEANVMVPIILGEACHRIGRKLVHISSGCIYKYDYNYDFPLSESRTPGLLRPVLLPHQDIRGVRPAPVPQRADHPPAHPTGRQAAAAQPAHQAPGVQPHHRRPQLRHLHPRHVPGPGAPDRDGRQGGVHCSLREQNEFRSERDLGDIVRA